MTIKLYQLFCSHCLYKKLTDGSDLANLTEVKTCRDCGGSRQFKCNRCGFLLKVTKASVATTDESMKAMEKIREQEAEKKEKLKKELERLTKQHQKDEPDSTIL